MTLPLYLTDPGALATAVVGSRVDLAWSAQPAVRIG